MVQNMRQTEAAEVFFDYSHFLQVLFVYVSERRVRKVLQIKRTTKKESSKAWDQTITSQSNETGHLQWRYNLIQRACGHKLYIWSGEYHHAVACGHK